MLYHPLNKLTDLYARQKFIKTIVDNIHLQKQFEKQVAEISNLSIEDRNTYLGDLRSHLSKYSNIDEWRNKLLSIYNQDGDQVWLPTDISPSKSV